MTVKQWLWWWDNSFYTNQTRGTVRLNRLKNWAQLSGSVNFTIELRREDRPSGTNQGTPLDKEGWDFCTRLSGQICVYQPWSTNIPGLRIGDVEELPWGNEEAQFETGSDQVRNNFKVVSGQKPNFSYPNQYYLEIRIVRKSNQGQTVWLKFNASLQGLHPNPGDEYYEYMSQWRTSL